MLTIKPASKAISASVDLPLSKSISNRVALLLALEGKNLQKVKLSDAKDTRLLIKALNRSSDTIEVEDAGTVMRFILAYAALQGQPCIIKGTERMHQRPIAPLVDALRQLGANIHYLEKEGYPPLKILEGKLRTPENPLIIRADISSQFVSAILMIASQLPQGLNMILEGNQVSAPYVDMTLWCMEQFGIKIKRNKNVFEIPSQPIRSGSTISVERDWSSAAFFYSLCALSRHLRIDFPDLKLDSIQGDSILPKLFEPLGIITNEDRNGVSIERKMMSEFGSIEYNFLQCPDLAQPWIFTCVGLGYACKATGLNTLQSKETQRITAITDTLQQMGVTIKTDLTSYIETQGIADWKEEQVFQTFKDHRMAMSLAALGALKPIYIFEPHVVEKSYPKFWEAIETVGLELGR